MLIEIKKNLSNMKKDEIIKNISIISIIVYPILSLILERLFGTDIGTFVAYFIAGVIFVPGVIINFFENVKKSLIMIVIYFLVVITNYIFHLSTFRSSITIIIKNFISCYLMFMIIVNIKNKEKFFYFMKIGGYTAIILTLIYMALMYNLQQEMLLKGLLIQLVLIIFLPINLVYAFKERKLLNIIFTVIGIVLINIFGSRTIILVTWLLIAMLTVVYYIKWCKNIKSKKVKIVSYIIPIIVLILIITVVINIQDIARTLYDFLNSNGIYNRTLRLLAEGEYLSNSSGRTDSVYPAVINKIIENSIMGYGIGMDRVMINNQIFYAHNIVLELFASYGVILGTLILIAISVLIYKSCKTKYRAFIVALIFEGILILMLTSSYTIYRGFWLFLAVIINIGFEEIKKQKSKLKINTGKE